MAAFVIFLWVLLFPTILQELLNLFLTGNAVTNIFNNDKETTDGDGNKVILKGIVSRSEIGLLSVSESQKSSCEVSRFLPLYAFAEVLLLLIVILLLLWFFFTQGKRRLSPSAHNEYFGNQVLSRATSMLWHYSIWWRWKSAGKWIDLINEINFSRVSWLFVKAIGKKRSRYQLRHF